MGLHFSRFMTSGQFARELDALRAYCGEYVGDSLLESIEEARLVVAHTRLRYPDPIARRMWLEIHPDFTVRSDIEPDGPRWQSAVELSNALHRWENHRVYGPSAHPLDDVDPRFSEFLQQPTQVPFERWLDMRVNVSNDIYPELFDSGNVKSFYTTWQLLLAAEVADTGVHCRVNLADRTVSRGLYQAIGAGNLPPGPVHCSNPARRAWML